MWGGRIRHPSTAFLTPPPPSRTPQRSAGEGGGQGRVGKGVEAGEFATPLYGHGQCMFVSFSHPTMCSGQRKRIAANKFSHIRPSPHFAIPPYTVVPNRGDLHASFDNQTAENHRPDTHTAIISKAHRRAGGSLSLMCVCVGGQRLFTGSGPTDSLARAPYMHCARRCHLTQRTASLSLSDIRAQANVLLRAARAHERRPESDDCLHF